MELSGKVLKLKPSKELKFSGAHIHTAECTLTLENISGRSVVFEIRSSAPEQYEVYPNMGMLKKDESVDVRFYTIPALLDKSGKAKHKFQVQCVVVPEGESVDLDSLIDRVDPEEVESWVLTSRFYELDLGGVEGGERDLSETILDWKRLKIEEASLRQRNSKLRFLRNIIVLLLILIATAVGSLGFVVGKYMELK